jgi:kumamolisin
MSERDVTPIPGSQRERPAAQEIGAADSTERTSVTILVRPANEVRPEAFGPVLSERRYLSREELAKVRGARSEDLAAVERFARAAGLTVQKADAKRRSVTAEGTVAQLNAAFGTELRRYRGEHGEFRGRSGALSVPAGLEGVITGVLGLDERPQARTHFRIARPEAVETSYTPPQLAELYAFPTAAEGSGQTIALIELGGGYKTADLSTYFASLGIAEPTIVSVGVDQATNAPTGSANGPDGEVELDVEVAGAIAPAARVVAYFAPNTDQGFLDAITTAIHDTTNHPNVISISWGSAESEWTQQAMTNYDAAFADAGMAGITVCVAVGDGGSADGVTDGKAHVDFPASSPHVLACGGTTLQATNGVVTSEVVWNDGATGGATGGGISSVFPVPTWQAGANVPPSVNGGTGRGVPDVAGDADPETGYAVRVDGSSTVIGGTSAVAPLWAGLIARLNQLSGKPFGLLNPILYANPSALRDITSGNNGAYSAGPGWDACTGLGSPNGTALSALA